MTLWIAEVCTEADLSAREAYWIGEIGTLNRTTAVSYTHLDVYKRQVQDSVTRWPELAVLTPPVAG